MSKPPSADSTYGFQDDPPPEPQTGKKAPGKGKALSEAEMKKALAHQYLESGHEEDERQAEWDSRPPRQRWTPAWIEHGPLIASGMCVLFGVAGLAACAVLKLALPFYILPGLFLMFAVIGFVYTWFGLNQ
jgi:hypothetical protein